MTGEKRTETRMRCYNTLCIPYYHSMTEEHPVSYYSRKLLPREVRYSTVEKECLAIKLSLEAFKVYLLGRRFKIVTDHRALQWINSLKDKNARLLR